MQNGITEEKGEQQAWSGASPGIERRHGPMTHQVVISAERAPSNEHGRLIFRHARQRLQLLRIQEGENENEIWDLLFSILPHPFCFFVKKPTTHLQGAVVEPFDSGIIFAEVAVPAFAV